MSYINLEYEGVPNNDSNSVSYRPFLYESKTGKIIYLEEKEKLDG